MRKFDNPLTKTNLLVLVSAVMLTLCGCTQIISFIAATTPKPKVDAQHDMSNAKLLIWIDDLSAESEELKLRRELTEHMVKHLHEHEAVGSTEYPVEKEVSVGFTEVRAISVNWPGRPEIAVTRTDSDRVFVQPTDLYGLNAGSEDASVSGNGQSTKDSCRDH